MIRFFATLFLFFQFTTANAQVKLNWLYTIHNGSDKSIHHLAIDHEANLISTGFFNDTLDFDPGPDTMELIANGFYSRYLLKTDSSGKVQWAKQPDFSPKSAAVNSLGNLFLSGSFSDTADVDLSDSLKNIISPSTNGSGFVVAYDQELKPKWVNQYPNLNNNYEDKIKINSKGDIYWTGVFSDTVDFDPDTGVFELVATSHNAAFITKMDSSGKFIWAKKIEGASVDVLEIDKNDNIFIAGTFQNSADFDLDTTVFLLNSTMGNGNPFVAKYNQTGKLIWAKSMGLSFIESSDFIKSMSIDDSSNVYLSGTYPDSIAFAVDSNTSIFLKSIIRHGSRGEAKNGFIAKLDLNGKAKWAKSFTDSAGTFIRNEHFVESIKVDKRFQVHALGYYGRDTLILRRYNSDGQLISSDSINSDGAYIEAKMVLDNHSSTYVVGRYLFGKIDFDTDSTTYYDSTFNWKGFIAKYDFKPITVGLKDNLKASSDLSVFPNPANDWFQVKGADDEPLDIKIYTGNGQVVSQLHNHKGIIQKNLRNGLYLMVVSKKNGEFSTLKLLVN